jgi:CHAT domain-containing protein/tetratricopeptide (TPR) repeat protein
MLRFSLYVATCLFLTLAGPEVAAQRAANAEDVVRSFYISFAAGRTTEAVAQWSDAAAPDVRASLERTGLTRCMTLHDVDVTSTPIGDARKVSAHVVLSSWSDFPADRPETRVLNETFIVKREAAGWRIVSRRSDEDAIAEGLATSDAAAVQGVQEIDVEWSPAELVEALCRHAILLLNQQQFARAAKLLDHARAVADKRDLAGASAILGVESVLVRRGGGPAEESERLAEQSLFLAEGSGHPDTIARALLRFGRAQEGVQGVTVAAPFERILAFADVLEDASVLAHAATQLAKWANDRGNFRAEIRYAVAAERYARASGDPTSQLNAHLNMGGAYIAQGDPQTASVHYEEALRLAKLTRNPVAEVDVRNQLAKIRYSAGEDARPLLTQSLALIEHLENTGPLRVELLRNRALMSLDLGDASAVEADLQAALDEGACSAANPTNAYADPAEFLARVRLSQKRYAEALAGASAIVDSTSPWTEALLAEALIGLGRCDEAYAYLDDAIGRVESLRALTTGQRQELLFSAGTTWFYHLLVALQLQEGKVADAFATTELAKGRSLRGSLARNALAPESDGSPAERTQLAALEQRIVDLNRQLATGSSTAASGAARHQELVRARAALADFRARLASAADVEPPRLDPTLGVAALRDLGQAVVLQYVVMGNNLVLFVAESPGSGAPRLSAYTIAVPRRALKERITELTTALDRRDLRFPELSAALFDLLLGPARSALRSAERVYVLPDEELWGVPFHALRTPDGKYLVETATISYATSLETVRLAQLRRRSASAAKTLLAVGIGNPYGRPASARSAMRGAVLDPIPEAEEEVRAIAALYGSDGAVLTGSSVREELVKREAGRYDVLHIAGHGVTDAADPMFSAVVLGSPGADRAEDGYLEAREIAALQLHASLAVLSACDTAGGRMTSGEGVIGLSWALLVAGCPTAVVSQWDVHSAATRDLMILFHQRIRAGDGPAAALRAAQLSLRKNRKYAHPFYWAPFIVMGAT